MKANMIIALDQEIENLMGLYSTGSQEKVLTKAIALASLHPHSAKLLNIIASATFKLEKSINCLKHYDRALKIQPDLAEAHNNIGFVAGFMGNFPNALNHFKRAIILNPIYQEAYNNCGLALNNIGQHDKAISCFKMSMFASPGFVDAFTNLGITLSEIGREEEAISYFKKALKSKHRNARVHHNFGLVLYKLGRYKEAENHFILSSLKKSRYYLLRCQFLRGDQKLFHRTLDQLLQKNEVHPIIGSLCDRASQRFGILRKNPFCDDPIKNFKKIDLAQKYDFKEKFIKPISEILNHNQLSFKEQKLLKGGRQTDGNLFLNHQKTMSGIQDMINQEIDSYRRSPCRSHQSFIKNWPDKYKLLGWLIQMENHGELKPHMHDEGWLSGCIYINVPPKETAKSGNLVICLDDDRSSFNQDENTKKVIHVKTGDLCLFPASLLHYTIPFKSTEARVVMAFDVVPD